MFLQMYILTETQEEEEEEGKWGGNVEEELISLVKVLG